MWGDGSPATDIRNEDLFEIVTNNICLYDNLGSVYFVLYFCVTGTLESVGLCALLQQL